jgi:large conductance mechanosensitive channel
MLKGFRDFILRGNVVDLAVAVIIGAAFGAITASLTADVITPMISAVVGTPDFSTLVVHVPVLHEVTKPLKPGDIPPGEIHIGKLLNALINFVLVAAAIYFAIVLPMQYLLKKFNPPAPPAPAPPPTKTCGECLSEIPLAAKRCSHCTQLVA